MGRKSLKKKGRKNLPPPRAPLPSALWEKGVSFLTALLLLITPFLFDPWLRLGGSNDRGFLIKDAFVLSVMTVSTALWLVRSLWRTTPQEIFQKVAKWREQPLSLLTWEACLVLFLALATASACFNNVPFFSRPTLVPLTLGTLFYFVLSRSLSAQRLRFCLFLQLYVSGLVGFHIFFQHFGYDPVFWLLGGDPGALAGNASGLLGQTVTAGGYLAPGLSLGAALLFSSLSLRLRLSLACSLVWILLGLLATNNRGGFLGAAVGLLALGLCAFSVHRSQLRLDKRHLAFSFALLSALGLLIWSWGTHLPSAHRLRDTFALVWAGRWDDAIGTRLYNWRMGLLMIKDRPFFGHGLGGWMPTLSAYKIRYNSIGDPTVEFYFQAHNEFLQVWVEMGTLALFVVSIGIIALLVRGVQRVRSCKNAEGGMEQAECMGLLAGLAAVLYIAMFSFSFHVSSTAVPAILMAAALTRGRRNVLENASLGHMPIQPGKGKRGGQQVGRVFLTGVVLVTTVYTLREVTKPFRASLIENRGDVFLLEARGKNHPLQIQEQLYWEAARWYQQALKIHPQDATALNSLGAALFGLKRYREAAQAFARALEVLPTGECYLNLGSAYYESGEHREAREAWEKGRRVKDMIEFDRRLKLLDKN